MQSTWINGPQGEFYGPPQGMGYLLAQRNADNNQAWQQLAQVSRGLGAAIGGAVQAYNDPSAFGQGTNSGFAALKGAAMNYNNATTGEGANFKQFAAMGKTADSLREAMKMGTPSTPDQQPKVLGFTDDEWKHIGTDKKIAALQGFQQGQLLRAKEQGLQEGALQMAKLAEQVTGQKQQTDAIAAFPNYMRAAQAGKGLPAMAAGQGPVNPPQLSPMETFAAAVQSGMDPLQASQMGENLSRMAALGQKQNADVRFIKSPSGFNVAVGPSGQFQFEPGSETQADLLTTKPNPQDIPKGYVAKQFGKGWRIEQDPSQWETITEPINPNDPFSGNRRRLVFVGDKANSNGNNPSTGSGSANGNQFSTAADVRAAFKAGKLTQAEAEEILKTQFKYQ